MDNGERLRRERHSSLPPWLDGNVPTRAWQARNALNWAKTVLLTELRAAFDSPSGCELNCGIGLEEGKWCRCGVRSMTFMDPRPLWVEEARKRWERRPDATSASFLTANPSIEIPTCRKMHEMVGCFDRFWECFRSKDSIRLFVRSVSSLLCPGGFFFGVCTDPSVVWSRCQGIHGLQEFYHDLYRVRIGKQSSVWSGDDGIEGEMEEEEEKEEDGSNERERKEGASAHGDSLCGEPVYIHISGEDDPQQREGESYVHTEYLGSWSEFESVAREEGLVCVTVENLMDFFEFYHDLYPMFLHQFGVLGKLKELDAMQSSVMELFSVFVFRKGPLPL
eukprot:TRINITY_DN43339_c1_g1_i1.p1 TRINITY_DN43339_c1_g1~~TRINITY_DN43339_c1_g1_i1.p1  ORF type:complete len:370 (+),score=78.95 TRINITY_DN43339_c1_g1_i1:107-1111(+)